MTCLSAVRAASAHCLCTLPVRTTCQVLDLTTIELLLSRGYTRVPVFRERPSDVIALLYACAGHPRALAREPSE